ncbi:MAG: hypothetical protein HPY69_05810 [Armatimonadetes bacterium]|nr:hypothetical protein [Armatimonadota bacterium]
MRTIFVLVVVICLVLPALPVFAQPGAPYLPHVSIPAPATQFTASDIKLTVNVPANGKATFYYDWDLLDGDNGGTTYDVGWSGVSVLDPGAPNLPFKGTALFNFMRVLPGPTFHCTLSGEWDGTLQGGPWRNYLRYQFTDLPAVPYDMTMDIMFMGSDGALHAMQQDPQGSRICWRIEFVPQ